MALQGEYLGMPLAVDEINAEDHAYFMYCGQHRLHLQRCTQCALLRFPPTVACPWCGAPDAEWTAVEARGTVHSYVEVHHAVQAAYRDRVPYLILLVDLDTQEGLPAEHDAIRIIGNLVTPDGALASREVMERVGIGSRVRMVFVDVGEGMALPQWTLDETAPQPDQPWRYPG